MISSFRFWNAINGSFPHQRLYLRLTYQLPRSGTWPERRERQFVFRNWAILAYILDQALEPRP